MENKAGDSSVLSKLSVDPSSSSKNSVLKGPSYTRWDIEARRSHEPYYNRLFEIPYKGRFQQKNRPNKFSLTGEPQKLTKKKKKSVVEPIKNYVDRICFAENLDSPKSPRSLTPPSSGSSKANAIHPVPAPVRHSSLLSIPEEDSVSTYLHKKRRASSQGMLLDLKQFSVDQESQHENDLLEFLDCVRKGKDTSESSKNSFRNNPRILPTKLDSQKKGKLLQIKSNQVHVDGAMYGPIIAQKPKGITGKLSEKFQLPRAMVERLAKKCSAKGAQAESKRKSMRGHMKKPFPQSESSSEGDGPDDYEEVKSLTLVRTNFSTIPKIRVSKRRRKDRLKTNRLLSKHQLNRIRYLFFDERQKWALQEEPELDRAPPPYLRGTTSMGRFSKSLDESTIRSEESFDHASIKSNLYNKLRNFIREYRWSKDKESDKGKPLNFKSYRDGTLDEKLAQRNEKSSGSGIVHVKKLPLCEGSEKGFQNRRILKKFRIAQPQKLFRQSRRGKSFRGIDPRDAQYLDPNFMAKQRFPELNSTQEAAYSMQCTSRYPTTMRKRLQVNSVEPKEETFGFGDQKHLYCLATDWDSNYVDELKATKKFKTFRVKTDIIKMREVMRQNFNTYYILENLANLRHKQRHEEAFIDNLNGFAQMCRDYLETMKVQAYDSLIKMANKLKPLEIETQLLEEREKSLRAKMEHATETMLGIEQRWDTIMRLQNYYYALMNTEWRTNHDWIHRRATDGKLEAAIFTGGGRCRTANIRDKSDPSGFAVIEHFEAYIFPNMDRMRSVRPDVALLRKGLHTMQSEVFTYLSQYNKTLWTYDMVLQRLKSETVITKERREAKQKQIAFRQSKQEFIEERNHVLQYEANQMTRKPLEEAIKNLQMRKVAAICEEMYKKVLPLELRSEEIDSKMDTTTKFARMHQYVIMDVLHALDNVPVAVLKFTERRTRTQRRKLFNDAKAAVVKQTRFELLQNQLRGFFSMLKTPSKIGRITEQDKKSTKKNLN